jgi:galactokinase
MSLPSLRSAFAARYGRPATAVARAPGRVNLLGEHTDYNEGFALPVALRDSLWFACAPRSDDRITLFSANLDQSADTTAAADPAAWPTWSRYVLGVAALLRGRGAHLGGFDALIDGDLPMNSGLSSSAAVEVAAALALSALAGEALVTNELIDLCCEAERRFAGMPCGVMDQTASLLGREAHALLLDCRDRRVEHVPLNLRGHEFFIVHSGVPRRLADSEYARRRAECAAAVQYFKALNPQVRALRDVTVETVRAQALQMPPLAAARALHVVTENRRTLDGVNALRSGDAATFGRLMNESHRSLRDDYEVSLPAVDDLVARLAALPGVRGARLTGAGFGGSIVGLAAAPLESTFAAESDLHVRPVQAGPGAALELA